MAGGQIVGYFNNFGDITKLMTPRIDEAIHVTANEVVTEAQAHAPVDTGALRESIHAVTDRENGYPQAAAQAVTLRHSGNRPNSEAKTFPYVGPEHDHEAIVAACVEHGMVNEFGGGNLPARPFFVPAVEHAAPEFFNRIGKALE